MLLSLLWIPAALAAGCEPPPPFVRVSGRVTADGQPLDDVVVTFVPASAPLERLTSSAVTDDEGHFQLRGVDGRSGAVVGKHRVTLEDLRPYRAPRNGEPVHDAAFASRVGESYQSVSATPLTVDVRPGLDEVTLEVKP